MTNKNSNTDLVHHSNASVKQLTQTRLAAAACLYALSYEKEQELSLLLPLLNECFPDADLQEALKLAFRQAPYDNIADALIDEFIDKTHNHNYEILPWREAVLKLLCIEVLAALRSSSSLLIENSLSLITAFFGDKARGSSKNACQIILGQRSKLRKAFRASALAALYRLHFYKFHEADRLFFELESVIKPSFDEFDKNNNFPFEDGLDENGDLNIKGHFILRELVKFIAKLIEKKEEIDEIIQNSSKKWRIARMSSVDLNILRLATYEIFYDKASTPRILINEAVELAKIFGAEQSKNFVNGILQQICSDNKIDLN